MCALHRVDQCFTNEVQHTVQLLTLNYEIFTIANIKKKEKNVRIRLLKGKIFWKCGTNIFKECMERL